MERIRLRLAKKGPARFMSHLDMARAVARALKRAGITVSLTEGFRPHSRLAFGPALALGFESEAEFVDVTLPGDRAGGADGARRLVALLNGSLPEGLTCLDARSLAPGEASVQSAVRFIEYVVRPCARGGRQEPGPAAWAAPRLEAAVRALRERGQDERLRSLAGKMRVTREPGVTLVMVLPCGPAGAVRPSEVLEALASVTAPGAESEGANGIDLREALLGPGVVVTRKRLLGESGETEVR